MCNKWVVSHPYHWTRSQEMWEMLQIGNLAFYIFCLYVNLDAEEIAFVLLENSSAWWV